MYIATVPNRGSPPAILLREGYREGGTVKNRTLFVRQGPREVRQVGPEPTPPGQPTDERGGAGGGRSANGGSGGRDGVVWRRLGGQAQRDEHPPYGAGLGHRGEDAPWASTAVADEGAEAVSRTRRRQRARAARRAGRSVLLR